MGIEARLTTSLPARPRLLRHYRWLAPAYPLVVRSRRLPPADVLITSSYAFAHGFRTENDAPQLCYCHSPLRFAWNMTGEYGEGLGLGPVGTAALRAMSAPMRAVDRRFAGGVSRYLANSKWVATQIESYYGQRAELLHPPVDTDLFRPADDGGNDGYFLLCGRLVEPYKRPSLVIEAFRNSPHKLVVAGDGPELDRLRRVATPNVEFLGSLEDRDLVEVIQRCAALIFPSRDDFGMIPIEVMSCGRPVLAYRAGGALETIVEGETGEFFDRQDVAELRAAVEAFEPDHYIPAAIRAHAESFGVARFAERLKAIVAEVAETGAVESAERPATGCLESGLRACRSAR